MCTVLPTSEAWTGSGPVQVPSAGYGRSESGLDPLLYLHLDKCELTRVRIYDVVLDAGVSEIGLPDL